MSIFDIFLLVIIGAFAVNGLFKGVIKLIGNIAGFFVGAYVASNYYLNVYEWCLNLSFLNGWMSAHSGLSKVIAFLLVFAIAKGVTALIFLIIEKVFNLLAIIPGSKYINNLLGFALGLFEGALSIGLLVYIVSKYALIGHFFGNQLTSSVVAPQLLKLVDIALPFLPHALKTLQSII